MAGLTDVDPDGLLEFSVVFSDRSLNHMSQTFQGVMTDISSTLKRVYNAHSVVLVPGVYIWNGGGSAPVRFRSEMPRYTQRLV